MDRHALITTIESYAPKANAASWDQSGIQIFCDHTEISHLAVALDPTVETIQEALRLGADAVLTHHPLALKPLLPQSNTPYYRVLKEVLSHDILLYAAHTSLDTNLAGPAGFLARFFSLKQCRALEPLGTEPLLGYGLVGHLPSPLESTLFFAKTEVIDSHSFFSHNVYWKSAAHHHHPGLLHGLRGIAYSLGTKRSGGYLYYRRRQVSRGSRCTVPSHVHS